ncbi:hypothetical protein L249_4943 [Ophiocordyceps polyrhachis-furcata BCC 54312]|uniref:SNF7 family protein n=1 Tax=Ophiocordyceps polyrhachis-furcata BCC 54312 TaxID=1330021 RepID=A0A367L3J9_9HYPO|nr:hypothetical protein L249_4943 [Ophiocordyceps polyrhachis-furcata BCC 54312]
MGELADYLTKHDGNFRKARLPALYSDFRPQRTLNPDGYRANVSAWRGALARLASSGLLTSQGSGGSLLVLSLDSSLLRALESRQYGQPLALGTVIGEAVSARDLILLRDFVHSPHPVRQRSWTDLPWSAVAWTLRQLGFTSASGDDVLPTGKYVLIENLEAATETLARTPTMAHDASWLSRVFTKAQFRSEFSSCLFDDQRLSDTDVDVLLQFLSRDKKMIEYDGQTIRFRASADEVSGITEEDTAVASIKELTSSLKHQVALLTSRIDDLSAEAKKAVVGNNRITALAALKSKKVAESSLSKRYATLSQLEQVAASIEQASDQVQLVKVMESSASALESLNAKVGGVERVDSAVDRLREQMSETDEVAAILAESTGAVVDEAEIDDELEALEKQDALERQEVEERRQKEREAEKVRIEMEELPSVPVTDPDTAQAEKVKEPNAL